MFNVDKFKELSNSINIELNEKQVEKFIKFKDILIEWNEKINLTTIVEDDDIIVKHFVDSLTCMKYIKDNSKVIDIGTGAGFPGIPVRIANESLDITLIDSLNKRIIYLNDLIDRVGFTNIEAIHGRAEEKSRDKNYREKYDIAIARAVANLRVLSEYVLPFVKVGGKFICMKGPNVDEEIEEAKENIKLLGGKIIEQNSFLLPGTDMGRTIIVIEKVKNTDKIYPRKKIK